MRSQKQIQMRLNTFRKSYERINKKLRTARAEHGQIDPVSEGVSQAVQDILKVEIETLEWVLFGSEYETRKTLPVTENEEKILDQS